MGDRLRYLNGPTDSARWDDFAFRPGDIVISTPSKCGTTWAQMMCALLVFGTPDLPAPLTQLSPWFDARFHPVAEVTERLDKQQHRRFIKTHTPLDGLPLAPDVTYVVVGRDPRDVGVSMSHHRANLDPEVMRRLLPTGGGPSTARPTGQRERLLQWLYDDTPPQDDLTTLRSTVWHLAGAWTRRSNPQVVLLHHADLSGDLSGQLAYLAGRLGITVFADVWPSLVGSASFDQMRARSGDLVPDERLGLLRDSTTFFRSGSHGQWRGLLNADDLTQYDARIAGLAAPEVVAWLHEGRQV